MEGSLRKSASLGSVFKVAAKLTRSFSTASRDFCSNIRLKSTVGGGEGLFYLFYD